MNLSQLEAALLNRLDQMENRLLRQEAIEPQQLLELITDLRDELTDCWNIIHHYEG